MVKSKGTSNKESAEIAKYSDDRLEKNAMLGMRKVDPLDIRPPQIILTQKSSDFDSLVDVNGNQAEIGQYFHTGKQEIYDTFKCYIIYASKGTYIDRRKEGNPTLDQYKSLGVSSDDFSLFSLIFRASALYTLSRLFSTARYQKRPMYSYLCEFEVKKLENKKGTWHIPVLRTVVAEKDPGKLEMLENMAREFDSRSDEITKDTKDQEEEENSREYNEVIH